MQYLKYFVFALLLTVGLSTPTFAQTIPITEGLPAGFAMGRVCSFPNAVSSDGVSFIKAHEGFRTRAYRDVGRIWTIGYGMTHWQGRRVTKSYPGFITRAKADVEFTRQLSYYEEIVRESVCTMLSQTAYDSLVSLTWNLGRVNDTIVEKLASSGSINELDFLSTATVRGRINGGLVIRRLHEYALFVVGTYFQ